MADVLDRRSLDHSDNSIELTKTVRVLRASYVAGSEIISHRTPAMTSSFHPSFTLNCLAASACSSHHSA